MPSRAPTWKGQESDVKHGAPCVRLPSRQLNLTQGRTFAASQRLDRLDRLKQKAFVCFMRDPLSAAEWAWPATQAGRFPAVQMLSFHYGRHLREASRMVGLSLTSTRTELIPLRSLAECVSR